VPSLENSDNFERPLPPYQPGRFEAKGTPLSSAFIVPDSKLYRPVRQALELMDSVHGDGVIEPLPVNIRNLSLDTLGGYALRDNRPEGVLFNGRFGVNSPTMVEEVGHILDHQGFNNQLLFESQRGFFSELAEVMELIKKSEPYLHVQSLKPNTRITLKQQSERIRSDFITEKDLDYHTQPREWFARAYLQYIAIRTGDTDLLRAIANSRTTKDYQMLYPRAWSDDEFEAIAKALESVFLDKGWLQ
jgi:hypothetical protein